MLWSRLFVNMSDSWLWNESVELLNSDSQVRIQVMNVCQSTGRPGGSIFEVYDSDESTGIVLQCYCTTSSLGGCLQALSGIHPFMWKPRPRVAYQSDHPLPSDRDCQAPAGHSQPAAACREAATYCHWLYTKHLQLVELLSLWGENIYSFCTDRISHCCTSACKSRWLDFITPVLSNLQGWQTACCCF